MIDMIRMKLRLATLMAAMMMTIIAFAKPQDWSGRVIDEKGEPMPFVNVVLLSLPDSDFVQGAVTDMDGMFKIVTDVNQGLFKVTCMGYQTLYVDAGQNLTPGAAQATAAANVDNSRTVTQTTTIGDPCFAA